MSDREERETEAPEPTRVKVTDKRIRLDDPDVRIEAEDASGAATLTSAEGGEGSATEARGSGAAKEASDARQGEKDVDEAGAKAAEYLDHLQRLKAEFDNYRKRVLKEQTRAVELATEPLMAKLLEVLDEFELALVAAEQEPKFEKFVRGVEMVYAKLFDILRSEGLERIDAQGRPFDPGLHEALLQSDGDAEGEAYVADVLRTGYTLKGRVVRPAGVKVARR